MMALTKETPAEAADELEKHREQFAKYLNLAFVTSIEVQMLTQAGRIDAAETRVSQLSDASLSEHERARLARIADYL
jgi:hypothetical protein